MLMPSQKPHLSVGSTRSPRAAACQRPCHADSAPGWTAPRHSPGWPPHTEGPVLDEPDRWRAEAGGGKARRATRFDFLFFTWKSQIQIFSSQLVWPQILITILQYKCIEVRQVFSFYLLMNFEFRICMVQFNTYSHTAILLFYLLMNFEFAWFSSTSILTPGLGFHLKYEWKHFHARKLITNLHAAIHINPSI
jgi:hypothetical protein